VGDFSPRVHLLWGAAVQLGLKHTSRMTNRQPRAGQRGVRGS